SQLAGNSLRRPRIAIHHSAGPTSRATSVKPGERVNMMITEPTNNSTLLIIIGIMPSRPWTRFRSEIERLTTWPGGSSSCFLPSIRSREENTSWRRSCCTSIDNRSEEHTSELQSRENLVCRLLLEKKKPKDNSNVLPVLVA